MRLAIIMKDLRQILTGNIPRVSQIVVTSRDNQLTRLVIVNAPETVRGREVEFAVPPHHRLHPLILPDIEVIVLRNFAVILERLFACGLLARSAEWDVADLQQLRRSKERHVRWIVIDGVDHAALVNRNHFESRALSFDSTGQPCWASANDDDIGARVRTRDSLRAWKRVWYLLRRQSALSFWRAQLSCEKFLILACGKWSTASSRETENIVERKPLSPA